MSLVLYFHPLSSYCHKALIALYESGTPFTPHKVDLMDAAQSAAFKQIWPMGKFPVLRDGDRVVPESTTIIEYLAERYPGGTRLIPTDLTAANAVRAADRFYDLHVHTHMQKIVGDRLRPAGAKDPHGVAEARAQLQTSYAMIEQQMTAGGWAMGGDFSLADCAAAPALFYGNRVEPLGEAHGNVRAYLERLEARPSFARVLKEAEPWFAMFPKES